MSEVLTRRRCDDCGQPTGKPYGRYCDAHRWRHRTRPETYRLTVEREAYLRAHYRPSERGISHRCARVLNVPKWRVCRWAAELGLTGPTTKGPNWTPAEDVFLEQHLGARHVNWIAKRLRRSMTAVVVRAKRIGLSRRDARSWFTATQVADGFGCDPSTVVRWIERGWLQARREGQDHPDGRAAAWRVEEAAIRRFIQQHPTAFSLAKVEQVWFLSLLLGSIGEQGREAA